MLLAAAQVLGKRLVFFHGTLGLFFRLVGLDRA